MAAVTIAASARLGIAASATAGSSHQHIWQVGTALYKVVVETADDDPHVYKSTDSAATWVKQDNAGAPVGIAGAFDSWLSPAGMLHVAYASAALTITVAPFDTSTDLWTTSLGAALTTVRLDRNIHILGRSDGDILVFATDNTDDADLRYARYESAVWTQNVLFHATSSTSATVILDAVMDGSDRAQLVIRQFAASLLYEAINSANTLEAAVVFDAATAANAAQTIAANYVPYDVGGTDTVSVAAANSTADIDSNVITLEAAPASGNIAAQESNIHTRTDLTLNVIATLKVASTRYIFWSDDADDDILYIGDSGSGWGTAASNGTVWQTLTGPTQLGAVKEVLGGVYVTWEENGTVYGDWFIAPSGGDATFTVAAATASAAGEAVTFDAASKLTVTEATAPAAGQAVTLDAAAKLTVTQATAPAAGEAVTLDAASLFTIAAATAPAAGEAVTLKGQARLPVTEATAPAQSEAVTLDAAAVFAVAAATAPAQGEAVALRAAVAASMAIDVASASAAADSALTGQGRLPVAVADAPAAGEAVTFDAAARFITTEATAPAQGENVALTAGAAAALTVTPATASAQGEAVTLDAAASMVIDTAAASAQGEDVTLDVAANLIAGTATATAQGQAVTFTGQGWLAVTDASASAEGENVILFGGTAIPGTLTVAPATAPAAGETVALTAASTFIVDTATAPAQGENVTIDAAALITISPASATAAGETVGLIGRAILTVTPADTLAVADGSLSGAANLALSAASADAAAGPVLLTSAVVLDEYIPAGRAGTIIAAGRPTNGLIAAGRTSELIPAGKP